MPDCLQNIVGLTDRDCACYDGSKPANIADLNASETGFYITDAEFGYPVIEEIDATGNCGDGLMWDMLINARTKALLAFRGDLSAAILKRHRNSVSFQGMIGKASASGADSLTETYIGHQILPRPLRDAVFVLEAVHLGLSAAHAVTVTVESNEYKSNAPEFTAATVVINSVAGKFVRAAFPTALRLPFYNASMQGDLKYFVHYTPPAGVKALSNRFTCCSMRPKWESMMDVWGIRSNDLEESGEDGRPRGKGIAANGLILEGYVTCDEVEWLCRLDNIGGYATKQVVARAIQHKAGAFLVSGIIDSAQINRFTLKPKEELYARRDYLQKEYMNAVDWIANNLPGEAVDCLTCKSAANFRVKQNIV